MYDSLKGQVDTVRKRLRLAFQQNLHVSTELHENFVQMSFLNVSKYWLETLQNDELCNFRAQWCLHFVYIEIYSFLYTNNYVGTCSDEKNWVYLLYIYNKLLINISKLLI